MHSFNDQGLILRRYSYGEGDAILVLFTRNHGKLKLVAKGVRKLKSRRGGHLDLFNQVEFQAREGHNMPVLSEVKSRLVYSSVKSSLKKMAYLYYLSELIDTLFLEEDRNFPVYQKLIEVFSTLELLNESDAYQLEVQISAFEVFVLKHLGYWSDDIHGTNYPTDISLQRRFNQNLIRGVAEKVLNSQKFIEKL